MRAVISIATALFAALATAQSSDNSFNNPAGGYTFTAGQTTTLTWKADTPGTVSLRLQQAGGVTTADSGVAIASNIANSGTYSWSVPADLIPGQQYTIEIIDDADENDYNFLPKFTVAGATGAASSTPASSSSSPTSTSASTTSTSSSTASTSATTHTTHTTHTTMSTMSTATTGSSHTSTKSSISESASMTPSQSSVPTTNAGVANRVSGGMLAAAIGAFAVL
ncbi:cell wall protein [Penicillium riverlandense]|uniref:cell wall protein n=1 Tax=Penicillium riverlandense TaxID=1903569 RepID=UPI002547ED8F|nr:cell wall protein [Penicillium riverlandense]KAJ5825751.1 cell wall protein [Penicillium riverlandense]